MNKIFIGIIFFLLSLNVIKAAELEMGVGVFATSLPKYLGSDEQNNYLLPFPYFYYKSDQLEVDRNAFTGYLWQSNRWSLDISASGSIPVKSDETKAREGMPDIDFVGEIGPVINYYLTGDHHATTQAYLGFHIRKAFASDFSSFNAVGWKYGPSLTYHQEIASVFSGDLSIESKINVDFADDNYLNYYYGVSEQYAHNDRIVFDAKGGYKGTSLGLGFTWDNDKIWLGSFVQYQNLNGAKQQESALVKKTSNWSVGLGVVWIFYKNNTY